MAVVQSFPLFNLPLLPLNEVIRYMCPVAQICLSLVFKKTNNLVRRKLKFNLEIIDMYNGWNILCKNRNGSEFFTIVINGPWQLSFTKTVVSCNFDNFVVPMKLKNNILYTYWEEEDKIKGYQKITSILCNAFKIERFSISFYLKNNTDYAKVIEHVQKLKSEFKIVISRIKLISYTQNENTWNVKLCRSFLEKFNDVGEQNIESPHLTYGHNDVQMDTNSCYCVIPLAYWFTFENLKLLLKCRRINLCNLKWTSQEVNQFLKKWMEISTMEKVELSVDGVNLQMALESLPVTRHNKVLAFGAKEPIIRECFEIQRNDRRKANIWKSNSRKFIMQTV